MSNPIILVITALLLGIGSDAGGADQKSPEMAGESGWGQLAGAPQEVQEVGQVVKEWFEAYLTNDLARAKELYVPSKREQAERDLQQLKRLLEVVSGWRFRSNHLGLRMGMDKEKVRAYLQPFIGLGDPKGELVKKACFEIFKEELETEAVIF